MINENDTNFTQMEDSGANGPVSVAKLKEYGKKAYSPLLNVVFKYQDEFTPYLDALAKGLEGGVQSLKTDNSNEAEKYVCGLFQEAADGINQACEKLQAKDVGQITSYISTMTEKKPSLMFSASYIAGIFFGRLSRHIISTKKAAPELNNEPPSFDQSIH